MDGYRRFLLLYLSSALLVSAITILVLPSFEGLSAEGAEADLSKRSWGGFDKQPQTQKCYRQERTAILLSVFLGPLGVDQFYAHHWPLAVFKLLIGSGGLVLWPLAVFKLLIGSGGLVLPLLADISLLPFELLRSLVCFLGSVWVVVDFVLWTVGGIYGTPGCGGTWRY